MMKIINLLLFLSVFVSFSLCLYAQGGKDLEIITETNKVALVMGNAKYQNGFTKLDSPENDAIAIGEALKRLGFRLVENKVHLNVSHQRMEDLVNSFADEIKRGGVGLFYFSGHGSQNAERSNFLVPVDTKIQTQSDLKFKAMSVEFVTNKMEESKNKLNILILDACRNNPLPSGTKDGRKGLNTSPVEGVYIAFAARDGQTASDGTSNGYSLYTDKLLQNLETPNLRLEDIFMKTRRAVKDETQNRQFPIDYGSVDGIFYFKQDVNSTNSTPPANVSSDQIKEAEEFIKLAYKCSLKDFICQINNYTKALNLNPYDAIAYNNRGYAYYENKKFDLAIIDFNKPIEINPKLELAYLNRGNLYYNFQQNDLAIKDYSKVIQLNPLNSKAFNNRGTTYKEKELYDLAIKDFNEAIKIDPNNEIAYLNRGQYYSDKGNYSLAINDYSIAIRLNPNLIAAFDNRGLAYLDNKELNLAIQDFTRAIQLDPTNVGAYNNRGLVYKELKKYTEAIQDFTKAIQLDPNLPGVYHNRADVYEILGEKTKAENDRKKASSIKTTLEKIIF